MKTKLLIVVLLVSVSAVAPFFFTSALCTLKEYMIDGTPSKSDLYAGIGGAALASISFSIDLEKPFRH